MRKLVLSVLLIGVVLGLSSCTQPEKTSELLEIEGYKNIEITGFKLFSCSDKDAFKTGFTAFKNGRRVSGTVCSGFLKGYTIRYD